MWRRKFPTFENTFRLDNFSVSAVFNENTETTHHSGQEVVEGSAFLAWSLAYASDSFQLLDPQKKTSTHALAAEFLRLCVFV